MKRIVHLFHHITEDIFQNVQRIVLFVILISAVHFYIGIERGGLFSQFLYMLANVIFMVLVFWTITSLLPKVVRGIVRLLVFLLTLVCVAANLVCFHFCHCQMTIELMYVLAGTNRREVSEYLSSYCNGWEQCLFVLAILVAIATYVKPLFRLRSNRWTVSLLIVGILMCTWMCMRNPLFTRASPIRDYFLMKEFEFTPDLNRYRHKVMIEEMESEPTNIVVIIGESFVRSHSSLYGYPVATNPRLQSMVDEGSLTVYRDVTSPETLTFRTFRKLLMLNRQGDTSKWYKRISLFDILGKRYYSYWLSNQCRTGMYDNVQGKLSELADQTWYSNMHETWREYDEVLLSPLQEVLKDDKERRLIVINLMGQHAEFMFRYPESFHRPLGDYLGLQPQQRLITEVYDNATLYNDSIVAEILHQFDSTRTLGLYFSDHGLDFMASKDDYIGHAIPGDSASIAVGIQIPFVVYTSPLLAEQDSALVERIKAEKELPFCTDHLVEYLCRILKEGVSKVHD